MTDIDIERLRKWATRRGEVVSHYGGCEETHTQCAVLALIERLEKAEAQRDRLAGLLRDANTISHHRGDKYGLCDAVNNDGCLYQSQEMADALDEAHGREGK